MARPQKRGIDYFPMDVDFFDDKSIRILKGKYGTDGVMVYLYILCAVYKDNGYYIKADDDFEYIAAADLLMSGEKIGLIINFLCGRSLLLDSKLFMSDKVLTSRGIQKRFQEAVKKRGARAAIEVEKKYWVLNEEETQPFIKCTQNQSFSGKNHSYFGKNPSYFGNNPPKVKKSKVKESKVNKSSNDTAAEEVINHYQKNIAPITSYTAECIDDWLKSVDKDVIIYAINEAVAHNVRNWKYINKIIDNHFRAGRTTMAAVEDANRQRIVNPKDVESIYKDNYDYSDIERRMQEKYDSDI